MRMRKATLIGHETQSSDICPSAAGTSPVRRSQTQQGCQRAAMRMRPAEYLEWRPCPYIG